MDDYQKAVLFSILILVPLAGWKITGMVKKLQKLSRRVKEDNKRLTPKQKEFIEFLEKASSQSKTRENG
tara:strand:- start:1498 stop:1704 length:207 start_codon:yes stop_codon:yes gene_type:complete